MPSSPETIESAKINSHTVTMNQNGTKANERAWEEIRIEVPWGHVAGKWYGDRSHQPVIALHGWQDNAASFDRLVNLLPDSIPILCIDLPGHGKSSHFPTGMQYYIFWDGISLVRRIVKHFGWQRPTLLGHSLGSAISFMYAASFPSEVNAIIGIDLYGPTVRPFEKYAPMTGSCVDKALSYESLPVSRLPCYSYDAMISLVVDAYSGSIDRQSAEILMTRGMSAVPDHISKGGYHFARDLRLKVCMMGMFSLEQVLCYAQQIKCNVLNIRAVPGMKFENDEVYPKVIEAMRKNAQVEYVEVPGTHHVHLNTPERIAGIITSFLLNQDIQSNE